ncbi:MAG: hypothetical protein HUJ54_08055 [Erysipelotrichaceae bacterium]|nr:hypothetical protein [Erysipelotrichaceae bacterium]
MKNIFSKTPAFAAAGMMMIQTAAPVMAAEYINKPSASYSHYCTTLEEYNLMYGDIPYIYDEENDCYYPDYDQEKYGPVVLTEDMCTKRVFLQNLCVNKYYIAVICTAGMDEISNDKSNALNEYLTLVQILDIHTGKRGRLTEIKCYDCEAGEIITSKTPSRFHFYEFPEDLL